MSARFDAAIRSAHQMVTEVDILFGGEVIHENLAVVSGSVAQDIGARLYANGSVALAEPLKIGFDATSPLTPFGYEFAVRRGIVYADGTREMFGLGVFPIRTSNMSGLTLVTSLAGFDRSQRVSWARLEDDYQIAAGSNFGTAIQALIAAGVPDVEFSFASTTFTTPGIVVPRQADRWEFAVDMARKVGYRLFFDGDGRCEFSPEPDPAAAVPVDDFNEGEGGVLVSVDIALDRTQGYNVVAVESVNATTDAVYSGSAEDSDPASPTYVDGPYGRQPRFYSSPLIASDDQASAAAASILRANLGVPRSVDASVVPNPKRKPGDVITINRSRLGFVNEVQIIDRATHDLGPAGALQLSTRSRYEAAVA